MLLESLVIGISSFLLALEPNNERIEGSFLKTVLIKSIPNALVMFVPVLVIMLLSGTNFIIMSDVMRNSIAMIAVTIVGFINLISLCRPFTKWRVGVCSIVGVGLVLISLITVFSETFLPILPPDVLGILPAFENPIVLLGMIGMSVSLALLLQIFLPDIERIVYKIINNVEAKKSAKKSSK